MPNDEPKPARSPLEADELTVQYSVPPELLLELAALDDEKTRVGPLPAAFLEEHALSVQPPSAAAIVAPSSAAPPAAPDRRRPMTPVSISDAELRALLRPQRVARWASFSLVLVVAVFIGAAVLSR